MGQQRFPYKAIWPEIDELRVHDPATANQRGLEDKGFITTNEWHEISWEIRPYSMRVVVDGEIRFETDGDYSGIESRPKTRRAICDFLRIRMRKVARYLLSNWRQVCLSIGMDFATCYSDATECRREMKMNGCAPAYYYYGSLSIGRVRRSAVSV